MSRVFLYKVKDSDDRDCCAYIENRPMRFECGHYFGGVNLEGSCYSNEIWADYKDIKTVLTETEYGMLRKFSSDIKELGYGIKKDDKRYQNGVELCKAIQPVYDKLNSYENDEVFEEVQREEKEWLMNEFELSEDDVDEIFDNYALEYRDRSIVGCVFDDIDELGEEEAWSLGYVKDGDMIAQRYFDTHKFGEDLVEEENYHQLPDGRVVSLMY